MKIVHGIAVEAKRDADSLWVELRLPEVRVIDMSPNRTRELAAALIEAAGLAEALGD